MPDATQTPGDRRLELVPLTAAAHEALVEGRREEASGVLGAFVPEGWPDDHDARFLALRLEQVRREPEAAEWLVRAVVRRSDAVMVGHAGFHGPPGVNGAARPGAVEIGYTIFAAYRRRGYATEAAEALIRWARAEQGIDHFIASVAPANEPSLAVVRKLGFVQTGEQWDEEDGLELVHELRLT